MTGPQYRERKLPASGAAGLLGYSSVLAGQCRYCTTTSAAFR